MKLLSLLLPILAATAPATDSPRDVEKLLPPFQPHDLGTCGRRAARFQERFERCWVHAQIMRYATTDSPPYHGERPIVSPLPQSCYERKVIYRTLASRCDQGFGTFQEQETIVLNNSTIQVSIAPDKHQSLCDTPECVYGTE
ncbi:hypothetical protein Slin14017_G068930 [Septoria linicola]|nr:hypothetical protein Slin14017_G068930 [Septoria linicola]